MAFAQSFLAIFLVLLTLSGGVLATTTTIVNNCRTGGPLEFPGTSADRMNLGPGKSTGPISTPNGSRRVSLNPLPSTIAEFSVNVNNKNTMDISLVDGFNVGLRISYTRGNCIKNGQAVGNKVECRISLDQCPAKYRGTDRCTNPNRDAQTDYSSTVKRICPDAYSWSKDDRTSTFTCDAGGDYTITFCP